MNQGGGSKNSINSTMYVPENNDPGMIAGIAIAIASGIVVFVAIVSIFFI